MSDFVTFFSAVGDTTTPPAEFAAMTRLYEEVFDVESVVVEESTGASLLLVSDSGESPLFYSDERGWIVAKGLIFDVQSSQPQVEPNRLLEEFVDRETPDWNRYEGTFALAAWDAKRRTACIAHDQAGVLSLYFGSFNEGLYATTRPVFLARALNLPLDCEGVQDFLVKGSLIAPGTIFSGLRRLSMGEHLTYKDGNTRVERHWTPYFEPRAVNAAEAATELASVAVDRVRRYAALKRPVVSDITGGYDTRMLVCAADFAGIDFDLTVNGPDDHEDVFVGKKIAATMNWRMNHFHLVADAPIDEVMRRDLLYRTNGELPFASIYHHVSTRPTLARDYGVHFSGICGEFARDCPWPQEFLGLGRRRLANINNAIRYRFLQAGFPPASLFKDHWYPSLVKRLHSHIEQICTLVPDQLTTQQLDAVHLWKLSGHFALWASALYNWLPNVAPLASAGFLETAFSTPWRIRLFLLNRRVSHILSPRAAMLETAYGGTSAPLQLRTFPREMVHVVKSTAHLLAKVNRTAITRLFPSHSHKTRPGGRYWPPFVTPEFRALMDPHSMYSRKIYAPEALADLLQGPDEDWYAHESLILKLANIEMLCRELDFEPDADFLVPSAGDRQ